MIGRFHNHFMCAGGPHAVVHAVGLAAGFALDAIEGIGMRQNPDLPRSFAGQGENRLLLIDGGPLERAGITFGRVTVAYHYPTLRDRVSANFHSCIPGCATKANYLTAPPAILNFLYAFGCESRISFGGAPRKVKRTASQR